MLKRKYANRASWMRLIERRYSQEFIATGNFKGYIALLCMDQVEKPMYVKHVGKASCIVGDGFKWLQYFPVNEKHSVNVIFNERDQMVQCYIDICMQNGVEEGIPYTDDLFLDLIVLPTGEVYEKDADELEKALSEGVITQEQYDLAYREFRYLLKQIKTGEFHYIKQAENHKFRLQKNLAAAK